MPVSALGLLAGAELLLPSLNGPLSFKLDPGRHEARRIRVAGKGYPGRGRHPVGDPVVDLQPVFPAALSTRQRKLLLQADAALLEGGPAALPEVAAWRQQHLVH